MMILGLAKNLNNFSTQMQTIEMTLRTTGYIPVVGTLTTVCGRLPVTVIEGLAGGFYASVGAVWGVGHRILGHTETASQYFEVFKGGWRLIGQIPMNLVRTAAEALSFIGSGFVTGFYDVSVGANKLLSFPRMTFAA